MITDRSSTDAVKGTAMLDRIEQKLTEHTPRTLHTQLTKAAILVALTDESVPRILFTRRASHLSSHGGEVAFPGGKQEPDDKDLMTTALREAEEEVNLKPQEVTLLGKSGAVVSRLGIEVTPIIGKVQPNVVLTANADELDRIFWVPLPFFMDSNNLQYDHWQYGEKTYSIPFYHYQGYKIWGLTATMLVELLNITLDVNIAMDSPDLTEHFIRRFKAA